jgi:hypothetical protein
MRQARPARSGESEPPFFLLLVVQLVDIVVAGLGKGDMKIIADGIALSWLIKPLLFEQRE